MSAVFAVDTNILVYAHFAGFEQHHAVRKFLLTAFDDPETKIVITPLVLHEFVHVVTDPRRFEPPLSMAEALVTARLYLLRSNVECVATSAEAMALALDLMEQHHLGRKRMADALLAGTLIAHGISQLITYNHQDFAGFSELQARAPPAAD